MSTTTSSTTPPRILGIIVNWNKKDFLQRLLTDLHEKPSPPFEILVVDNASTDGSPEMIRERFPQVHLHETGENLGGTGGFNAGMRWGLKSAEPYDYFWLMDNDIIVHDGALEALLAAMQTDKRIALAGSTILALEDPNRVIECGARVDWNTGGLLRNAEGPRADLEQTGDALLEADYCAACSMLARVRAIRNIGLWDPEYFIAWDDIDWGVRMKRAGYRVVGAPKSFVQHETFMDRRAKASPASTYVWDRNALYFIRRLAPPAKRAKALRHQFRMLTAMQANYATGGNASRAEIYRRAMNDFLEGRMGKPDEELFALRDPERKETPSFGRLRRVAFLAPDNHGEVLDAARALKLRFKETRIHFHVFDLEPSMLRAKLPRARFVNTRTRKDRLAFARRLARNYDGVVALAHVPPFLFEQGVPNRIRMDGDRIVSWERGGLPTLLRRSAARARVLMRAELATRQALRMKLPPADYFQGI